MPGPPPLPVPPRNLRLARFLNLMLPGAGLIYLGRLRAGVVLAGLFLLCFTVALGWFLVGYTRYLKLAFSEDLLKGDTLERIGEAFPRAGLVALALVGVILHLVAMALLRAAARESGLAGPPAPGGSPASPPR